MSENDLENLVQRKVQLRELKRKAKAQMARSAARRRAKLATRGAGVDASPGPDVAMNQLVPKNLDQKGESVPCPPQEGTAEAVSSALEAHESPAYTSDTPAVAEALKREETANAGKWRDGSLRAAVYTKPANPRMLLVTFENGSHGRVVLHPSERGKFGTGAEVWAVRANAGDVYVLAGKYNRYGRRVA